MKKFILILILLIGCATSAHAQCMSMIPDLSTILEVRNQTKHNDHQAYIATIVDSNPQKFELIHRIATTIHKWKLKHDRGAWIECGKRIKNKTKSMERAWLYAWSIVEASESVSDEQFTLIPWSLVAIYSNESVFDRCAMGPGPRGWAYKRRIVRKNRGMLSHSEKQVLKIINGMTKARVFRKTGYDIGPCQLLSRFYKGNSLDMMTVYKGSYICAREARERCVRYKVAQPQLFWPGRKSKWYQSRVNQRVRRMGIPIKEQFDSKSLWYDKVKE
jgi:hypothetical protein